VKPKRDLLGKRERKNILKNFEAIACEPGVKRIKQGQDLTEMIREHGSARVMGMLQAFTLLRPMLRQKLMERER